MAVAKAQSVVNSPAENMCNNVYGCGHECTFPCGEGSDKCDGNNDDDAYKCCVVPVIETSVGHQQCPLRTLDSPSSSSSFFFLCVFITVAIVSSSYISHFFFLFLPYNRNVKSRNVVV